MMRERTGLRIAVRVLSRLLVGGEFEVAGTGLRGLPESLRHVGLTWDEVEVDERIAVTPEALTARERLDEPDKDRRRMTID
jgi:hypothetical protein